MLKWSAGSSPAPALEVGVPADHPHCPGREKRGEGNVKGERGSVCVPGIYHILKYLTVKIQEALPWKVQLSFPQRMKLTKFSS